MNISLNLTRLKLIVETAQGDVPSERSSAIKHLLTWYL